MTRHRLELLILEGSFAVARLGPTDPLPAWAAGGIFSSITRTGDELSAVCEEGLVPGGVRAERGWRCFRIAGSQDFSMIGVLASVTAPLAAAEISLFAISTFDTDYLLVKQADFARAIEALETAGHRVRSPD